VQISFLFGKSSSFFVLLAVHSDPADVLQAIRETPMRAREEKQRLSPPSAPKHSGVAQKGQFPLYFSFAPEQKYF
jgi:hypothetical protein